MKILQQHIESVKATDALEWAKAVFLPLFQCKGFECGVNGLGQWKVRESGKIILDAINHTHAIAFYLKSITDEK